MCDNRAITAGIKDINGYVELVCYDDWSNVYKITVELVMVNI